MYGVDWTSQLKLDKFHEEKEDPCSASKSPQQKGGFSRKYVSQEKKELLEEYDVR